jgi:anti-sigma factor RsiW
MKPPGHAGIIKNIGLVHGPGSGLETMSKCKDVAELLTDYLEGSLPRQEATMLHRHIGDCPACEQFIKSFKVATDATRNMLMQQMPKDFDSRLQSFLRTRIARTDGT